MRAFFVRALPVAVLTALAAGSAMVTASLAQQRDPMITGEPPADGQAPEVPRNPLPSPPAEVSPDAERPDTGLPDTGNDAAGALRSRTATPPGRPLTEESAATQAERLDALFAELKKASSHQSAAATAAKIEEEWGDSGSATVDLMLVWAGEAMTKENEAAAFDFIEQAIILKPDYAEAWNRRATLHYGASDFGKSLVDIEKTLSLEPRHYGALMGLGMILEETDRKDRALDTYMRVLDVYPANKGAQDAVGRLSEELSGQAI